MKTRLQYLSLAHLPGATQKWKLDLSTGLLLGSGGCLGVITVSWTQSEGSTGCCTTLTRYFVVGDGMDPTEAAVVRIHPLPECLEYDSLRFSNWDMGVSVPRDTQRARGHWGWSEVSRLKGKARKAGKEEIFGDVGVHTCPECCTTYPCTELHLVTI